MLSTTLVQVWPKHTVDDSASEIDKVCACRRDHADRMTVGHDWDILGRKLLWCVRDEDASLSHSTKWNLANVWRMTWETFQRDRIIVHAEPGVGMF